MIPSEQESEEVLVRARAALAAWGFWRGSIAKVEAEFYMLDLTRHVERLMALTAVLFEIGPEHRRGPNPPNDSASHPPFAGVRLYAFRWNSAFFGKLMYLKFALPTDEQGNERFAIYSLHESRP